MNINYSLRSHSGDASRDFKNYTWDNTCLEVAKYIRNKLDWTKHLQVRTNLAYTN